MAELVPIWLCSIDKKIVTKITRYPAELTVPVHSEVTSTRIGQLVPDSQIHDAWGTYAKDASTGFKLKQNGSDMGIITRGDIVYPVFVDSPPPYISKVTVFGNPEAGADFTQYNFEWNNSPGTYPNNTIKFKTESGKKPIICGFFNTQPFTLSIITKGMSKEERTTIQAMMDGGTTAVQISVNYRFTTYQKTFKFSAVKYNDSVYLGGTAYSMYYNTHTVSGTPVAIRPGTVMLGPMGGFGDLGLDTIYPSSGVIEQTGFDGHRRLLTGVNPEEGQWGYLSNMFDHPENIFEIVDEQEFMERTGAEIGPQFVDESTNPYDGGGDNDDDFVDSDNGTGGSWDLNQDPADMDHASVDSSGLGLYSIYTMTPTQISKLSDALFTRFSEVAEQIIKSIFGSPLDAIISLVEYPMPILGGVSTSIHFIWDIDNAYGISGNKLSSEYAEVNFGTITVPRFSNSFYDMEPYTKAQLYIPYVGFVDMIPSEIMGMAHANAGVPEYDQCVLHIHGWIHLSTGEMCVQVESTRPGNSRMIVGSYSAMVGRMLPLSGSDFSNLHGQILKTGALIAAAAVSGGAAAAAGGGAAAGAAGGAEAGAAASTAATGDVIVEGMASGVTKSLGPITGSSIGIIANVAPTVARQTHFTSGAGRCASNTCFLVIEYPHQNTPSNQSLLGYATNTPGPLVNYSGYTEVRTIWLRSSTATAPEVDEILSILKGGIIIA